MSLLPWLQERAFSADQRKSAAKDGAALPDGSFPIRNAKDLENARRAVGRADPSKRAAVKAHIRKRAKALGVKLSEEEYAEGVLLGEDPKLPESLGEVWSDASRAAALKARRLHLGKHDDLIPDHAKIAMRGGRTLQYHRVEGDGTHIGDIAQKTKTVTLRAGSASTVKKYWYAYDRAGRGIGAANLSKTDALNILIRHHAAKKAPDSLGEADFELAEVGSTHEKTIGSKGKGLFGMKGAQLPAAIQHVYNDLVESGKHPVGGPTYRLAIGIVKNWAHGKGTKDPKVVAKAQAAIAEWEKLKARAHADDGKK